MCLEHSRRRISTRATEFHLWVCMVTFWGIFERIRYHLTITDSDSVCIPSLYYSVPVHKYMTFHHSNSFFHKVSNENNSWICTIILNVYYFELLDHWLMQWCFVCSYSTQTQWLFEEIMSHFEDFCTRGTLVFFFLGPVGKDDIKPVALGAHS